MFTSELEPEAVAHQLGAGGVDNLVANAERICDYQQKHIELTNQGTILGLEGEFNDLVREERRIEELLTAAPPSGDVRRLRRRAIYCWALTAMLTLSGLAFTLLTLAPFRLGWMCWLFAVGIAGLTPFLVEKLLEKNEVLVKVLTAVATVAAVAGLMFLAEVRGNLLEQQFQQDQSQSVVIDDSPAAPEPENNFYEKSNRSLELAMLLLAFSMEVGAGLALREAWRSAPDASEDWKALRDELAQVRRRKIEIVRVVVDLRNGPGIFAARFWRDFYRAMLSNAVRSAMTKLLVLVLAIWFCGSVRATAADRLDLVVAIDLTQSVAVSGPDGKSEFQKNVEGVAKLLSQVPAGSRVTVIGITDHSFAQPYILLSARVGTDPGYFGERLNVARGQLVRTWKVRSGRLDPLFKRTDILGALELAAQMFAQDSDAAVRTLVVFSDMRQDTPELNLESLKIVPPYGTLAKRFGPPPKLQNVNVEVLGADGAGRSDAYWRSLQVFWTEHLHTTGASLKEYTTLRGPSEFLGMR